MARNRDLVIAVSFSAKLVENLSQLELSKAILWVGSSGFRQIKFCPLE